MKNQAKRGIVCDWYDSGYYARYLHIKGFDVEAEDADVDDDDHYYLTIKRLHAKKWNRRTNHVIAYLDRITVWDRVKKDDVSVMDLMGNYTLAQVMEFIKIAQESKATNVLAALMEYKNDNYADFDPMEEFTLD